tara:strand:- start:1970 stop:3301 length:1332 start_codon:yes stop_codon:yes gene_type:complete
MTNKKYFFIGIGGIGMSSIAHYLLEKGNTVFGYDKSINKSTKRLISQGVEIINDLSFNDVPDYMKSADVVVVYTPAIKEDNIFLKYFRNNGLNRIYKRSEVLGEISNQGKCIAVAGTHGKTTTTAIIAHLLYSSGIKFKAFIGGFLKGYNSNYLNTGDDYIIIEADEYDRSFLQIEPDYAIITSIESDHLDVYGDFKSLKESFELFKENVKKVLIADIDLDIDSDFSFSVDGNANYSIKKITNLEDGIRFDFKTPDNFYSNIFVKMIGLHNLKNTLAALALIDQIKEINFEKLLTSLSDFQGVERRMNVYKYKNKIIIDDYAHHPTEIESVINTLNTNYKNMSKAVVFQPHLFTRTRDFINEFAEVLSKFDEVYLLDIYPAREKPITGISSETLLEKINSPKKEIIEKESINNLIVDSKIDVITVLGAGNLSENLNVKIFENV